MTDSDVHAMPVLSPVQRHRPWISDGVWIAHESLQLFHQLAAVLPRNGVWKLQEGGPVRLDQYEHYDLAGEMARVALLARPCVVDHDEVRTAPSKDDVEAVVDVGTNQLLEVLDEDGAVHRFNLAITNTFEMFQRHWTWKLAVDPRGATLVGFDRKDRPRCAIAALRPAPADDPVVPILPGVVPDMLPETQQRAMDQAHEDLPPVPGTSVTLRFFSIDEGLAALGALEYSPEQLGDLRSKILTVGGTDPHIVIASREPIE